MKKVLFICMSNIRRSKMGEAIFEKLSGSEAMSAGIDPADKPDENVGIVLKEIGVPVKDLKPKKVTDAMFEEADKIITFRCEDKIPEKYKSKVENWELGRKREVGEKPLERTLDDLRNARDIIYEKVKELVERLKSEE
jgi:protein-tyrosine-phosphatase